MVVGNALDLPGYPIAPAVRYGGLIETAGVIPIEPETGELLVGGIEELTRLAIDNLERILLAAGSSMTQILFVDVVLADPAQDFDGFNAVYAERFDGYQPARRTIGGQLVLPGLRVEMRATAAASL